MKKQQAKNMSRRAQRNNRIRVSLFTSFESWAELDSREGNRKANAAQRKMQRQTAKHTNVQRGV